MRCEEMALEPTEEHDSRMPARTVFLWRYHLHQRRCLQKNGHSKKHCIAAELTPRSRGEGGGRGQQGLGRMHARATRISTGGFENLGSHLSAARMHSVATAPARQAWKRLQWNPKCFNVMLERMVRSLGELCISEGRGV